MTPEQIWPEGFCWHCNCSGFEQTVGKNDFQACIVCYGASQYLMRTKMNVAKILEGTYGDYLVYNCPGCKREHSVPVPTERQKPGHKAWQSYNGSLTSPTVTPSVKHTCPPSNWCCHYFITEGQIHFCGDCTHELAGQVHPLPEMKEDDED